MQLTQFKLIKPGVYIHCLAVFSFLPFFLSLQLIQFLFTLDHSTLLGFHNLYFPPPPRIPIYISNSNQQSKWPPQLMSLSRTSAVNGRWYAHMSKSKKRPILTTRITGCNAVQPNRPHPIPGMNPKTPITPNTPKYKVAELYKREAQPPLSPNNLTPHHTPPLHAHTRTQYNTMQNTPTIHHTQHPH